MYCSYFLTPVYLKMVLVNCHYSWSFYNQLLNTSLQRRKGTQTFGNWLLLSACLCKLYPWTSGPQSLPLSWRIERFTATDYIQSLPCCILDKYRLSWPKQPAKNQNFKNCCIKYLDHLSFLSNQINLFLGSRFS